VDLSIERVNRAHSNGNSKRGFELESSPLDKVTIFHEGRELAEGSVGLIPYATRLWNQVFPREETAIVDELLLVLVAEQPAHE